jgi:polyphosphate kinase
MKKTGKCYTNRELSWLQFNERVLNEAGNPRVPLAERMTFASIYQTNLDEFFMVRVGTLMMQMNAKEKVIENKTGMTSEEQVKEILAHVCLLEKKKAKIYEQLMGELEPKGIRIINFNRLSNEEGRLLEQYFDAHIAPFLSPMVIGKQQPFPFLANKQLYAIVLLTSQKGKKKTGIVPCSNSVFKRLIEIPTRPGCFMLSEELILHFISKLYPKYEIREKSIMRVTRNADIDAHDLYDEDMDYRDMMEQLIKKRVRLDPVRVELSRKINDEAKQELSNFLEIGTSHIINAKTPLDLSFVFTLQNYLREQKELFYEKRSPRESPALSLHESILSQIEKKDVLLSYPFESMKPFIKMLNDAAEDPDVVSIKMTLYRVADRSKIIDALIEAAENGKEVVVLVELRARFDEANNIEMSHRLEEAGCQILYGLGDYKVHSKLCLITRRKGDSYAYITQIGTGNYNEKTSRLYTDLSLITANQEIGADAAKVFLALQQGETVEDVSKLLVAPKCLQNKVLEMMEEQITNKKAGKEAYIGVKINSLTDKVLIDKMIEASKAGVRVDLIVRGICCLKPQIPGVTENIRVISVVGRYLEHSRIYRFGVGDEEKIYIASADFMTRNTIRRVEVAAPIYDPAIRERIRYIFDTIMQDDEKGKEQNAQGIYEDRHIHDVPVNSQEIFFQDAYDACQK